MMHWFLAHFLHFIGADTGNSRAYYFWSAFGSAAIAWCAIPLVYLWHHNCKEKRSCLLPGHPRQDSIIRCHKHHKRHDYGHQA